MWQLWRRSGERKEGMKLSLPSKLVEKLDWVHFLPLKTILHGISLEDNLALDFQCKTILHWISYKSNLT
jgi:hypothetical protein